MNLDSTAFIQVPMNDWNLKQCIILDWHDAPLEGFCELSIPKVCFYFKAFAIKSSTTSIDDYLYIINVSQESGLIDKVREVFKGIEEPKYPFWIPSWNFTIEERSKVSKKIDSIITFYKKQPEFILKTDNMTAFRGIWQVL